MTADSFQVMRHGYHESEHVEGPADVADGGTVVTGDLLEKTDGANLDAAVTDVPEEFENHTFVPVAPHSTDGGVMGQTLVCVDARQRGMELGDEYAPGDNVFYREVSGGGAHLRLAAGESVTNGDPLVSAGDGTVRAGNFPGDGTGDDAGAIVGEADENMDASTADAATDPDTPDDSVYLEVEFVN